MQTTPTPNPTVMHQLGITTASAYQQYTAAKRVLEAAGYRIRRSGKLHLVDFQGKTWEMAWYNLIDRAEALGGA